MTHFTYFWGEQLFCDIIPNQEKFEDTKGTIRHRKSKKVKQHNGQTKKDKQQSFPKSILYFYALVLVKMAEQRAELKNKLIGILFKDVHINIQK